MSRGLTVKNIGNGCGEISKYAYVFCSELTAPDDFKPVFEHTLSYKTAKSNNTPKIEKLFIYEKGLLA